jgi:hypothetical protein
MISNSAKNNRILAGLLCLLLILPAFARAETTFRLLYANDTLGEIDGVG